MDASRSRPLLAGTPMDRYFHACALVRDKDEEYRVLGPFFREGIAWGEKVVHMMSPEQRDEDRERLRSFGIDVDAAEQRGQLEMRTWDEAYLQDGHFDMDRMLSTIEEAIEEGRASGHPRTRISGSTGWAFQGSPGPEQLMEYEMRVNEVLARTRQPAVCVYEIQRMSGEMVMDMLRTHPLTVVAGVMQENPLFTPPEQFLEELRLRHT